MVASYSDTLINKVQSDLENLLDEELGESNTPRTLSYATFRISYLRAVSKLRPTFFEDDEDFLDKEKRMAEWEKRQRFNQLKKVWIKYDKISPDKARDLGAEDQEIENDLDTIEEEIQEEWQDFAEELLDMLDDDEDDEDFGDEEDLDDLEHWRFERKQMRQDASLLKRRILERTMQRRAREEEERQRVEEEDRQRRQEELEVKARRAAKMATVHEAALVALSPDRRDKKRISFQHGSPERGSPPKQHAMKSPLGRLGISERNLESPSKQRMKPSIAGLGMSERNLVSPSKQQMSLSMATNIGTSERNLVSPSKYKMRFDALEKTMDFTESSSKHKSKNHKVKSSNKKDDEDTNKTKKSKSGSSKDEGNGNGVGESDKKGKKSTKGGSRHSDADASDHGLRAGKYSRRKSKNASSKDSNTDFSHHADDAMLKQKNKDITIDGHQSPPKVPKTPQIKRQTMDASRSAVQLMCPSIDESAPESPGRKFTVMPTRQPSMTPSISENPFSFPSSPDRPGRVSVTSSISEPLFSFPSSPERPDARGVSSSKSEEVVKEIPRKVSSLRERFMYSTTPLPPSQMSFSKCRYNSSGSLPLAVPLSGLDKREDKSDKGRRQSLRSILKTLERHELISIEELKAGLTDLSEIPFNDTRVRNEFASGKGNNLISQILHNHHQNEESIMEACCRVLVPITSFEDSRDTLAHLGVIEDVLVGMLFHKTSADVQEWGCDALASFAANAKYQNWIVASNGIKALLKTQAEFYLNADVQTACFRCMTQLALNNRETSRHLAAEGFINVLMATMYMPEHESCVKLHRAALRAISVLALNDEANRGAIAKHDGIYLTLLAMESFHSDEELQQYACEALCSLATEHAQNCDTIFKQDGLKILSKTMKDHSMHEGVQTGALSLLTQMTEQTEVCKKFAEEGGIDRVLVAMRNFETIKIHEQGCLTLCNMSIQNENKETIRTLGGIRMIVSAMRLLGDSTFVQKSGCRALGSLATNDQSKVTIAASGGISAMLSAMKTHSSAAGVQALAITALRKLATITRNRHIMKSNDGTDGVEAAMMKFSTHAHLQENGKALVKLLDPTRALILSDPPRERNYEGLGVANDAISIEGTCIYKAETPLDSPENSPTVSSSNSLLPNLSSDTRPPVDAPGFRAEKLVAHV